MELNGLTIENNDRHRNPLSEANKEGATQICQL